MFVGGDAHIAPSGTIVFAGDDRKNGAVCRVDVGIAPYKLKAYCRLDRGHCSYKAQNLSFQAHKKRLREIPEPFFCNLFHLSIKMLRF